MGVQDPVPVVISGTDVSAIDINVAAPAGSPPVNARLLGVGDLDGSVTAFSTGGTVRRGESRRVVVFGPGLNGSLRITVSGPADIVVSNIFSTRSENDDPGVSFDIAVSASAVPGARTVVFRAANDDITVFTAGLEVLP